MLVELSLSMWFLCRSQSHKRSMVNMRASMLLGTVFNLFCTFLGAKAEAQRPCPALASSCPPCVGGEDIPSPGQFDYYILQM